MKTSGNRHLLLVLFIVCIGLTVPACGPDSPDLMGTLECPPEAAAGEQLGSNLGVTVTNEGTWDAGEFLVDLVISSDTTIPVQPANYSANYGEDVLLEGGREGVDALGPGSTQTVTLYGPNTIPADTPAGTHYLGLVVDSTTVVGEYDENNNTANCEITIIDCPTTAEVTNAQIIEASGGTVGFARLRLRWAYSTGELPERLLITVYRFQGGEWDNIMRNDEPFELPDPTVTESDVVIFRLFDGDYRLVFNAFYSCDREAEFTFEQPLG